MGGMVCVLGDVGFVVIDVVDVIEFFEMMDGWVKMFYFKIYGGFLVNCNDVGYMSVMEVYVIQLIDMLVVNFYFFEEIVCWGVDYEICIENIDIGGLVFICVVVKNYVDVVVLILVDDYDGLIVEFDVNEGGISFLFCKQMVVKVYG